MLIQTKQHSRCIKKISCPYYEPSLFLFSCFFRWSSPLRSSEKQWHYELNLNGGRTLNDCRAHTEQFVNDKRERSGEESAKLWTVNTRWRRGERTQKCEIERLRDCMPFIFETTRKRTWVANQTIIWDINSKFCQQDYCIQLMHHFF